MDYRIFCALLIGIGIAQMMAGIYQAFYFPTLMTVTAFHVIDLKFLNSFYPVNFCSGHFNMAFLELATGVAAKRQKISRSIWYAFCSIILLNITKLFFSFLFQCPEPRNGNQYYGAISKEENCFE